MSFINLPTHYWTLSSTYSRYGMIHQDLVGSTTLSPVNAVAFTYESDGPVTGYTSGRLVGYDLGPFFALFIKNLSGTILESEDFLLSYDLSVKRLTWTVNDLSISVTVTLDTWKRVIVGYDDTGIYLWVDGVKYFTEGTVSVTPSLVYFDGNISELGTWSSALSDFAVEYLQQYFRYPFNQASVSDDLTVDDVIIISVPKIVIGIDYIGVSDEASYNPEPCRVYDVVVITDEALCRGPIFVNVSDNLIVDELNTRHGSLDCYGEDSVTIEDSVVTRDKIIFVDDSLTIIEDYSSAIPLTIKGSDSLEIGESIILGLDITFVVSDELAIIDAASRTYEVDASDDLTIEDSFTDRTVIESLIIGEEIIFTNGPGVTDDLTVSETIIVQSDQSYRYDDSLVLDELASYILNGGPIKEYAPT